MEFMYLVDIPLVEFICLVFTRMPGESYRRWLGSLLLCLCDVFRALIKSLVCWFCTSALGLVLVLFSFLSSFFLSAPHRLDADYHGCALGAQLPNKNLKEKEVQSAVQNQQTLELTRARKTSILTQEQRLRQKLDLFWINNHQMNPATGYIWINNHQMNPATGYIWINNHQMNPATGYIWINNHQMNPATGYICTFSTFSGELAFSVRISF